MNKEEMDKKFEEAKGILTDVFDHVLLVVIKDYPDHRHIIRTGKGNKQLLHYEADVFKALSVNEDLEELMRYAKNKDYPGSTSEKPESSEDGKILEA